MIYASNQNRLRATRIDSETRKHRGLNHLRENLIEAAHELYVELFIFFVHVYNLDITKMLKVTCWFVDR